MNLMGKIFTLLIFLMSVVFLVVAVMVGASDRNWKQVAAEMNAKAQQAENSLSTIQTSTQKMEQTLERERVARALQLANLESQNKQYAVQLKQLQGQLSDAVGVSLKRLDELEKSNNRLAQQDKELAQLKTDNKQLVDDIANQFKETQNLQNQVFEQNNKIATLEEDQADLVNRLAKSQKVLTMLGADENFNTAHIPQPVEAVVLSVGSDGLFSVAVGMDDGIRVGHEMDIYRGSRFVGNGKVVLANENKSVLKGIAGLMQAQVRKGDNVSTKL